MIHFKRMTEMEHRIRAAELACQGVIRRLVKERKEQAVSERNRQRSELGLKPVKEL